MYGIIEVGRPAVRNSHWLLALQAHRRKTAPGGGHGVRVETFAMRTLVVNTASHPVVHWTGANSYRRRTLCMTPNILCSVRRFAGVFSPHSRVCWSGHVTCLTEHRVATLTSINLERNHRVKTTVQNLKKGSPSNRNAQPVRKFVVPHACLIELLVYS